MKTRPSHHDLRASTDRFKKHNDGVAAALDKVWPPGASLQELSARAGRRARSLRLLTGMTPTGQRVLADLVFAALEYAQRGDDPSLDNLRSAAVQFEEAFKGEP